ncbi:MAG: hypothetical protein FWF52_02430 [Candidatus Azobacteroides sp.]|nr:hypothetical protein [Candidatus Azobacteroides sp.]
MNTENPLAARPQPYEPFNFFNPVQFETMQRVCKMFSSSELVPDIYKASEKNPVEKAMANCMIAVETAQRIGASPLMIMQNMCIIYGRPSWSSKFLIATVNTCGRFNPLQYKFTEKGMLGKVDYTEYEKVWVNGINGGRGHYKNDAKTITFDGTEITDIECTAFTTAKGSDKVLESSPVSIRLAIQEGWYTKAGSKWPTMTKQMLMYRAASFWTNVHAPELSMGMKTEDEIRDIVDVSYEEVKEDIADKVSAEIAEKANKGTVVSFKDAGDKPNEENSEKEEKEAQQAAGGGPDKTLQTKMPDF